MMLAHSWRWFPGWVRVEAEGGYPERLLNAIAEAGIAVWGVRVQGERLRFSCFAQDYRDLRPSARRACVRMRVRRKHGLPFWAHRYRARKGLAVGFVLYCAVLALLTPRIWVVDVVGNGATATADILAVAQDMGVQIGKRMDALDIKRLEIDGLDRLPSLVWMTVNPSGCVARVEVSERKPTPQVLDLSRPSDMVALRDGQVVAVTVVSGQSRVLLGEAVSAGSVLISGRLPAEDGGETLTRAYGEVWAQTERRITVEVPLTYYPAVADGYVAVCPTLTVLGANIPLYAGAPTGDSYVVSERAHFLTANGLNLPLGLTNRYYIRTVCPATVRSKAQAAELARRRLAAREKALFADASFEEIGRQTELKNGVYTVTVTYACLENIAQEEPIL